MKAVWKDENREAGEVGEEVLLERSSSIRAKRTPGEAAGFEESQ